MCNPHCKRATSNPVGKDCVIQPSNLIPNSLLVTPSCLPPWRTAFRTYLPCAYLSGRAVWPEARRQACRRPSLHQRTGSQRPGALPEGRSVFLALASPNSPPCGRLRIQSRGRPSHETQLLHAGKRKNELESGGNVVVGVRSHNL